MTKEKIKKQIQAEEIQKLRILYAVFVIGLVYYLLVLLQQI